VGAANVTTTAMETNIPLRDAKLLAVVQTLVPLINCCHL